MLHWDERKRGILFSLVRIGLGIVFVTAAVPKILHPDRFAEAVFNYQILPPGMINPFSLFLPWVELVVGILLVAGWWVESAAFIAVLMLFTFTGVAGFNLVRGLDVACGCFGSGISDKPAGILTLLRDVVLLGMGVFVLIRLLSRPGVKKPESL